MSGKYRPSNGTEGEGFISTYCMNCVNCDPDSNGKKQCTILARSFFNEANDPDYPSEWTYNDKGRPMCTAFKYWDWEESGNPDDPENPNYQQPPDPNQISLF